MSMGSTVETNNEKAPSRKKRIVTFALRPDLIEAIDSHARQSKISRNWVVERIVEGWLADKEAGF